jgi:DNA-binding transcriptional MerR regulator
MASRREKKDNTASIASKFGVSIKALRLYEQIGMLVPPRNSVGWRMYGHAEEARLSAILTLKKLGFSVSRVAEMLKASGNNLESILADQEAALHRRRRETHLALNLIRVARVSFHEGRVATADELADALRQNAAQFPISPEIDEKARQAFLPEQIGVLDVSRFDNQTLFNTAESWLRVHADVAKLAELGDPKSPAALDVARRADALIRLSANNDEEIMKRATKFWAAALADPKTASQMPLTKPQWDFLHRALAEFRSLQKR